MVHWKQKQPAEFRGLVHQTWTRDGAYGANAWWPYILCFGSHMCVIFDFVETSFEHLTCLECITLTVNDYGCNTI
jgi:hypothetical protein